MAITSTGYDGEVAEGAWAAMLPLVGSSHYGVAGAGDWKVTAHATLDRGVNIAAGTGWGQGVRDVNSATVSLQGATIASGTRWDMVVARRNWSGTGGNTSFVMITGTATKALPSRNQAPGGIDDQPLALVQFTAGQTAPSQIVDLRCWARNGGLVAKDTLALSYMTQLGSEVTIGGGVWRYILGANDVPYWESGLQTYAPLDPTGFSCSGSCSVEFVGAKRRITVDIQVQRTGANKSVTNPWTFVGSVLPAAVRGTHGNLYLPVAVSGGGNNTHWSCSVSPDTGELYVRALGATETWTTNALFNLNFVYYI